MSEDDRRKNLVRLTLVRLDEWLWNNRPQKSVSPDDDSSDDEIPMEALQTKLNIIHFIPEEWEDVRQEYYNILQKYASWYGTLLLGLKE
jgi:hypothetical protein